jgi:hypothetical protein
VQPISRRFYRVPRFAYRLVLTGCCRYGAKGPSGLPAGPFVFSDAGVQKFKVNFKYSRSRNSTYLMS